MEEKLKELNHVKREITGGGDVLVLDRGSLITAEDEAMLQALHSRSVGGIDNHLKILEKSGSNNFMKTFYVGYGHKSIGDCADTTIFIEGVSMLAAKAIQDSPLYNGQEASTRYIDFSKQKFINPLNSQEGNDILESQRIFYLSALEPVQSYLKETFPISDGENPKTYEKAINAKSFDITRGFLPAGASTNLAWHSNLRQVSDRLLSLRHHKLNEIKYIANSIEEAVLEKHPNSFSTKRYEETEIYQNLIAQDYLYHNPNQLDFEVISDNVDREELNKYKKLLTQRPNSKTELPKYLANAGELTFGFLLDYGSFRDIQRHRAINQRMPLLTTSLGFNSWYLESLPEEIKYMAEDFLGELEIKLSNLDTTKEIKQYYTPMGYNTSNRFSGDIPSIQYLSELRSTIFVHPTLRKIAIQIGDYMENKVGIPLYLDREPERFDIKRGEHDIVLK